MKLIILFATFVYFAQAYPGNTSKQLNFKSLVRVSQKDCKSAGIQCANCETAIWCTENGNGGYDYEVTEECNLDKEETCLNGRCVTGINPNCATAVIQFPCNDIGIFPDPYDCTVYHVCCSKGSKSIGEKCNGNYYYDAKTTYCRNSFTNVKECPTGNIYKCQKAGDVMVNNQNKSIYYVCTNIVDQNGKQTLYPKTRLCPNGKEFNPTTSTCK